MEPTQPDNPYAAPTEFGIGKSGTGNFTVNGKKLFIQDGSTLPPRCIKTNEAVIPGENGKLKTMKLTWINPWWSLLIFVPFGIIFLIILSIFKTARGSITVSLSKRAIRKKRLILLFWLGLTVLLFFLGVHAFTTTPELGVAFLAGSVFALLIAFFTIRYLTTVKHSEGWFAVKGFHRDFLRDIQAEDS